MIIKTPWSAECDLPHQRRISAEEIEQAWPVMKADMIAFMRRLGDPFHTDDQGKIRWMDVQKADKKKSHTQQGNVEISRLREKLHNNDYLSFSERLYLESLLPKEESAGRGRKQYNRLSEDFRNVKLAICAFAASEYFDLDIGSQYRTQETIKDTHKSGKLVKKNACDLVSDCLSDLSVTFPAINKISSGTIHNYIKKRSYEYTQDCGFKRTGKTYLEIAEIELKFMKRNSAAQRRKYELFGMLNNISDIAKLSPEERCARGILNFIQDVIDLPAEAFGEHDQCDGREI